MDPFEGTLIQSTIDAKDRHSSPDRWLAPRRMAPCRRSVPMSSRTPKAIRDLWVRRKVPDKCFAFSGMTENFQRSTSLSTLPAAAERRAGTQCRKRRACSLPLDPGSAGLRPLSGDVVNAVAPQCHPGRQRRSGIFLRINRSRISLSAPRDDALSRSPLTHHPEIRAGEGIEVGERGDVGDHGCRDVRESVREASFRL